MTHMRSVCSYAMIMFVFVFHIIWVSRYSSLCFYFIIFLAGVLIDIGICVIWQSYPC